MSESLREQALQGQRHGKTREEFLTDFPQMADWVAKMESFFGPFERCGSLTLAEGRHVSVARFARVWHVSLFNPANVEAEKHYGFNLSPEAMCALVGLYETLRDPVKTEGEWAEFIEMLRRHEDEQKAS